MNGRPLIPNPKRTLESNHLVSKINFSHYDSVANWLLPCGISLVAASMELKSRPFDLLQHSDAWHQNKIFCPFPNISTQGQQTPGGKIASTARLKIQSQSQILRYGRSIFCLLYQPRFSDFFDLCLHWVSVVRVSTIDSFGHTQNFRQWDGPDQWQHRLIMLIKYHAVLFLVER